MNQAEEIIEIYLNERRARISVFLDHHLDNQECFRIQKAHLFQDLIKNPINVLWAMPYFSLKKSLEIGEKIGFEKAGALLDRVPRSFKTDYQKDIEQLVLRELFEIQQLEDRLREICEPQLLKKLIHDVRSGISQYCAKQNELSDLIASGCILVLSHFTFGDKSLDLFGLGHKIAGKYAHKKAASNFFLGESLGNTFYKYSPPTPSEKHVFLFTALVLIFFALMTTVISVLSFPTQKRFGITAKQLNALMDNIHDKLILTLAKSKRNKNQLAG